MAKTYKLSKKDICELYDLKPATLDYHINNRKPSKAKPLAFPEGIFNAERGCKMYNALDVKKYAEQSFIKKEDMQKPLRLHKPLTRAEIAKEWEPTLNVLFGAEQQKMDQAVERSFEKLLKEEKKKNERQQKIIFTLFILIFVILFIPLAM